MVELDEEVSSEERWLPELDASKSLVEELDEDMGWQRFFFNLNF